MNVKTRQRLIGFLLLLLLAAILAPLVLRSPHQVRVSLDMAIPPAPKTQAPSTAPVVSDSQEQAAGSDIEQQHQAVAEAGAGELKQPAAGDNGSAAKDAGQGGAASPGDSSVAANAAPAPSSSGSSSTAPASSAANSATGNQASADGAKADTPSPAFTVQVASFSDENNAEALVKRLKAADYDAYHRTVQQGGNTWQRVYVGPVIKRADAQALQKKLADDQRFELGDGLIVPFVP